MYRSQNKNAFQIHIHVFIVFAHRCMMYKTLRCYRGQFYSILFRSMSSTVGTGGVS